MTFSLQVRPLLLKDPRHLEAGPSATEHCEVHFSSTTFGVHGGTFILAFGGFLKLVSSTISQDD